MLARLLLLLLLVPAAPAWGAICGDGIPDPGEECDDGNLVSGDGCSDLCALECAATGTWQTDIELPIPSTNPPLVDFARAITVEAPDGSITGVTYAVSAPHQAVPISGTRSGASVVVTTPALGLDGTLTDCDHITYDIVSGGGGFFTMTRLRDSYCGDGTVDAPDESCDDGNWTNGDGCQVSCKRCGNSVVETGETCDDGDAVGGDGCSADCRQEDCGNSVLDVGEECDDGNGGNGDGCSSTCEIETCGNGVLDPDEGCDDGNIVGGDGCTANCELEECGNGVLDPGEACEDGNLVDGDGCSSACAPDGCAVDCAIVGCPITGTWEGFSFFTPGIAWTLAEDETGTITGAAVYPSGGSYPIVGSRTGPNVTLDVGGLSPSNDTFVGTTSSCGVLSLTWEAIPSIVVPFPRWRATYCGDGVVQPLVESCDDGNFLFGDACTALCTPGVGCGNGIVDPGEECDDGNPTDGDGCSACEVDTCGDGVLDPDEACDDGNPIDGDGCSSSCEHDFCGADCAVDGCPITGTWRVNSPPVLDLWTLIEQPDGSITGKEIGESVFPLTATGTRTGAEVALQFMLPTGGLILDLVGATVSCGRIAFGAEHEVQFTLVRRTYCGDGATQSAFEDCDDGNLENDDLCSTRCEIPGCGNGIVDPGESCDDANLTSGDGCASCALESCWSCTGGPSACSPVADGTACDDGVFCTATGTCSAGSCVGSGDICAGGVECGRFCDESRHACAEPAGTSCLDDGLPETEDVCDGYGTCTHPNPGDPDADGIIDDGDSSGAIGDHRCAGGATAGCDDNCRFDANPDQADADGDGVGDACDSDCFGATGATIGGTIYRDAIASGNEIPEALVQACTESCCAVATADAGGAYQISRLNPGTYRITAWGAQSEVVQPTTLAPIELAATDVLANLDIVVRLPVPLPPGTTITSQREVDGVPVLPARQPLELSVPGCPGGSATYEVRQADQVMREGALVEGPSGTYSATIPAWNAANGSGEVVVQFDCPAAPPESVAFDFWMWIDPSGHVRTGAGAPIAGASVTLLRADDPLGPFVPVPDGSAIMSPSNRQNPDVTDANGHFGWDVLAGWYVVRTERGSCSTDTPVLRIPPPVTDLDLRLACPDPLLCYQAADRKGNPKFAAPPAMSLADLFRSWSTTVSKPNGACTPSTIDGEAAGAAQEHLVKYPVKAGARFTAVRNRVVQDRFGTLRIDVLKPLDLQLPSAASLLAPLPAPAAPELDDFQCYAVKLTRGAPRFATIPDVSVDDPLGTVVVNVLKPKRLCVPTDRDGSEPGAGGHRDHLLCYQVKLKSPKRFQRLGPLFTGNALGERPFDVVRPKELCVPARSSS